MEELGDDLYIIVPKWERFQHYKDRDPVWIKVYVKLLHDPAYLGLSLASKGLLQVIWLAYASSSLSLCIADARRLVGASNGIGHQLISLRDAGFIDISASRLLATKEETETEKEKERNLQRKKTDDRHRRAAAWIRNGAAAEIPIERLAAVLEDEFKITDPDLIADLVSRARGST